jgi:hypothetical protein
MKANPKRSNKNQSTALRTKKIGNTLGTDWSRFDVEQFRMGLNVELEHGARDPSTDVTGNDPILTGKIALAHLNESERRRKCVPTRAGTNQT